MIFFKEKYICMTLKTIHIFIREEFNYMTKTLHILISIFFSKFIYLFLIIIKIT